MIDHTMIVSFESGIPDIELDRYLKEFEQLMPESGLVQSAASQRHIRVPGDDRSPVSAAPALGAFIRDWQARFPYKVVWANHAPLA